MTSDLRAAIDNLKLAIATGRRNLGKVKNKTTSWRELRDQLSTPAVGIETLPEYLALPRKEQDSIKNVGFFIGAHCDEGHRKSTAIAARSLVTFDIDDGTPGLIDTLEMGLSELCQFEFFTYSTRKYTPKKPRLRVVIPLAEPVKAEAYEALARVLASKLDLTASASMDAVDDVSFRLAQMMYLPSHCRDAAWFMLHNCGDLVVPRDILRSFGDWRDHSKLPFSEKQGQKRSADPTKKAEDPTTKSGIIGSFCRTFDVPAAIETFLPDVYEPGDEHSDKPRYTFVGGSTTNGAIVEDDGLFLYSYHTTDPCSDRLVNAWDLVRIHKFGDLDGEAREDTSPGRMPSFEAMVEFASAIPEVAQDLAEANYDIAAMFDDVDEPETDEDEPDPDEDDEIDDLIGAPGPAKPDKSWLKELEITKDGQIKNTVANIAQIVIHDPRLSGVVQYNEFTQELVTRKPLRSKISYLPHYGVRDPINGDLWQDHHDRCVRVILESARGKKKPGYGLKVSDRDIAAAVDLAGRLRAFHPVKEYFEGLRWDGTPRLDRLFIDFLGTPDTPYHREIARLMLIAAVTRVYEPGHKYDYMVIVEGLQGKRKSTFFNVLARHWFAEMEAGFDDTKKAVETMHGALILEVAELSQFNRNEVEQIKAFVSRLEDKVRLSYDRREKVFPRQSICAGTTNNSAYLRDTTGNRRFLPAKCGLPDGQDIDTDKLAGIVDQLWAEAVAAYRALRVERPHGNLPLYLHNPAARAEAVALQESRMVETEEDGMVGIVGAWLDTPVDAEFLDRDPTAADKFENLDEDLIGEKSEILRDETCAVEIWLECFDGTKESYSRNAQLKMGRMLHRLPGWELLGPSRTKKYGVQKVFRRIST